MGKVAAIIGGGVIGGGWAARFLLMGWDVRVFDPDPEAERKIGEVLDNLMQAGLEHHTAIVYGEFRPALRKLATLINIEIVELTN